MFELTVHFKHEMALSQEGGLCLGDFCEGVFVQSSVSGNPLCGSSLSGGRGLCLGPGVSVQGVLVRERYPPDRDPPIETPYTETPPYSKEQVVRILLECNLC